MKRQVDVDGSVYDLVPALSQDSLALYLNIHIEEHGKRVALFGLRCAVSEPQFDTLKRMAVDELMDLAHRRGGLEDHVRGALQWQSDLRKINQEWGVAPVFQAWFPENYER